MLTATMAVSDVVSVWVYHKFPPFIVSSDEKQGLSYDLARFLTAKSKGKHEFVVEVVPRARLNNHLVLGVDGIVAWASPAWFGDVDEENYLWVRQVMKDYSVVISPSDKPLVYENSQSFVGRNFVGVKGHRYSGLDALIEKGEVPRTDLQSQGSVVQFVASGRGDAAIVSNSAARYFAKTLNLSDKLYFAEKPHARFDRGFLVQPDMGNMHAFLAEIFGEMKDDPEWQTILSAYGVGKLDM